jgi:hypothetical protein
MTSSSIDVTSTIESFDLQQRWETIPAKGQLQFTIFSLKSTTEPENLIHPTPAYPGDIIVDKEKCLIAGFGLRNGQLKWFCYSKVTASSTIDNFMSIRLFDGIYLLRDALLRPTSRYWVQWDAIEKDIRRLKVAFSHDCQFVISPSVRDS